MSVYLQEEIKRYLNEVLGLAVGLSDWEDFKSLPYMLRSDYTIKRLQLFSSSYLILLAKPKLEVTPAAVFKHIEWLGENTDQRGIFCAEKLVPYNRKRMIEYKIPFIIPGNQLYIPDLGIDLREHFKQHGKKKKKLGPAAQIVLLSYLLKQLRGGNEWTATSLHVELPYSKMSMGRALDELCEHELIELITVGREKIAKFKLDGKELWDVAKPLLKSPVRKRVYLETSESSGSLAGLSALSELSMLNKPERTTRAVTQEEWKAIQTQSDVRMIPEASRSLAPFELEIWNYDPGILSKSGIVDPVSLYLSLENETDERVEGELDTLIDKMSW